MDPGPPPVRLRPAEFERLYDRHSREVWALAYARRMDAGLALDIVQESFLRLWKCWGEGETVRNPRAWLMRVARNLAEDDAKSAFRRNGTQAPDLMSGVGSRETPPLEKMERTETHEQVREALTELDPADRELLTFRYALEYDTPRIAAFLGISITAVHMRLSRARQRLAHLLTAQGVNALP